MFLLAARTACGAPWELKMIQFRWAFTVDPLMPVTSVTQSQETSLLLLQREHAPSSLPRARLVPV